MLQQLQIKDGHTKEIKQKLFDFKDIPEIQCHYLIVWPRKYYVC